MVMTLDACKALDITFKWFERQDEYVSIQLLQLKVIRDLAAIKIYYLLRQD